MIRVLRDLPPSEKRAIVAMFNPGALQDDRGTVVPDEELWPVLVSVLKEDVLRVKPDADLPGALRDRLVEVAQERLGLADVLGQSTDEMTDLEIALAIVDFILGVAVLAEDHELEALREELGLFFRTRPESLDETAATLLAAEPTLAVAQKRIHTASETTAATGTGGLYDRIVAELENDGDQGASESGGVGRPDQLRRITAASVAGARAAEGSVAAVSASGGLMAGSAAMAGGALLLGAVGAPVTFGHACGLGAVALATRKQRKERVHEARRSDFGQENRTSPERDAKARLSRARRSKMVQNVSQLCFAVVGELGNPERARVVVLRHLRALDIGFIEKEDGTIHVGVGSANLVVSVEEIRGRALVSLSSEVYQGLEDPAKIFATLLELNKDPRVRPGRFAMDPTTQAIEVNYQLLGDSLDIEELAFAIRRVGLLADAADDLLKEELASA